MPREVFSILAGRRIQVPDEVPQPAAEPRPVFRINVTERDKDGRLVSLEVLQLENPNVRK